MDQIKSVIIAATQSVAKVYVIGAFGYIATQYPKANNAWLPIHQVPTMARFTFHILTLSLIYSTTAQSVTVDTLGQYWFIMVGAICVLTISYIVATLLGWTMFHGQHHQQQIIAPSSSIGNVDNGNSSRGSRSCACRNCPCRCRPTRNSDNCSIHNNNNTDFVALRIAATFPNIVALPILIFPSLCEFSVVYEGYSKYSMQNNTIIDPGQLQKDCQVESNTMIFCYFFIWSLIFWTFGYPQLMTAAQQRRHSSNQNSMTEDTNDPVFNPHELECEMSTSTTIPTIHNGLTESPITNDHENSNDNEMGRIHQHMDRSLSNQSTENVVDGVVSSSNNHVLSTTSSSVWLRKHWQTTRVALGTTFTSPGFLALLAGVLTGLIPPLQKALFVPGGALRFLGDALDTMGQASSPLATMVVAASLVPVAPAVTQNDEEGETNESSQHNNDENHNQEVQPIDSYQENPIMSDPNFGPIQQQLPQIQRHIRIRRFSQRIRRGSSHIIQALRVSSSLPAAVSVQRHPNEPKHQPYVLIWFTLSRLIIAPALVTAILVGFDCGSRTASILQNVSPLAKLVVLVNSCLPGALIVVVVLKSDTQLSDSANAVAKVYLPTYLLSIVTIAAWTALGLYVTIPDMDGKIFCQQ